MRGWMLAVLIGVLQGVVMAGGMVVPQGSLIAGTEADYAGYYAGLGAGKVSVKDGQSAEEISATGLVLQAGYQFNAYIALEGRLIYGVDTTYDPGTTGNLANSYSGHISGWGLYLKPILPMGKLSVYGLIGYGGLMLYDLEGGDAYEGSFQWGAGLKYRATKDVHIFLDYVKLYDNKGFDYRATKDDINAEMWSIGITIRF